MIISEQKSDIEVIGDIKEFKSSIDPKNLEFITTLLSSNLYSAPERSFIREIVSNAWDSQVEANTTDIPIIIKITETNTEIKTSYGYEYTKWSGRGDITIRDFGTGLSPERFNEVYRNIGSSTKRESNAYHGAFGIGHLSGFSCSNTMYITSYYEGNCYEYIGIKDANTIVYTLIATNPTTEKSGLEVTIKNVVLDKYLRALKYISFFPNVYLDYNNSDSIKFNINDIKIKKYNSFWVASESVSDKLLLGNVLYPLNMDELNYSSCGVDAFTAKSLVEFISNIDSTGVVLKFDIGELSVTPNRESIIYTKECNSKIINKILDAKLEVEKLINNSQKDYTDIIKYNEIIRNRKSFDFFSEKITPYSYGGYELPYHSNGLTYKSRDLTIYNDILNNLLSDLSYCSKCYVDYSVYSVSSAMPYKYRKRCSAYTPDILILKEDIRLNKYIKGYLATYHRQTLVLKPLSLSDIKREYSELLKNYIGDNNIDFIIQEIIDYLHSKSTEIDFNTNEDFLEYKATCKEEEKRNKKINPLDNEEVNLYIHKSSYIRAEKKTVKSLKEAITYLKSLKQGIVFVYRDTSDSVIEAILTRGFLPVFVKQKVREALKDCSFTIDVEWVLHKDPMLSYIKSIREVLNSETMINESLRELSKVISTNYQKDIKDILNKRNLITNSVYGRFADSYGKTDDSVKSTALKLKSFIEKYNEANDILEDSGLSTTNYSRTCSERHIGLIAKILIKQKSFMVNPEAYRYSKRNKLINVLCKK